MPDLYVDCDDFNTYPTFLSDIYSRNREAIIMSYGEKKFSEYWMYARAIENTGEQFSIVNPILEEIINELENFVITAYHSTRVLDKKMISVNGLEKSDKDIDLRRINEILDYLNFPYDKKKQVLDGCIYYWERDSNRKSSIHFYSGETLLEEYKRFSDCLGGEKVFFTVRESRERWPYNQLFVSGYPIAVKFRLKFSDIDSTQKEHIALEFFRYTVLLKLYELIYKPEFDAYIYLSVPSIDILKILDY